MPTENTLDLSLLRTYHRKKSFERAIAEELRDEIVSLTQQHPDWPKNYIRVLAEDIIKDALKQAKLPN